MQEINAWLLSNQDFEAGKALYFQYGKNSFFKTILSKGPTPYSIEKLEVELKALAPAPPAIEPDPVPDPVIPTTKQQPQESKAKVNLVDATKYLEFKEYQESLYRQLDRCMAELDLSDNSRFLLMTAKQILSLHAKIRSIWTIRDFYDENGHFPDEEKAVERSPAEEKQLLRVSIWKANERLKNPKCRDVEQTRKLIETNKARIIELGGTVR